MDKRQEAGNYFRQLSSLPGIDKGALTTAFQKYMQICNNVEEPFSDWLLKSDMLDSAQKEIIHSGKTNIYTAETGYDPAQFSSESTATTDNNSDRFSSETTRKIENITENIVIADRFEIKNELGKGAMGIVYKTYDRVLHKDVALKFPKIAEKEEMDAFIREAEAATGLRHPGIIGVYNINIVDNRCFLVMDLVKGINLKEYLQKHGAVDVEKISCMMQKIAEALDYAHGQGIIHRDLKPANIMLNDEEQPILMDFGIAKNIDDNRTQSGVHIGSPRYMSPEQAAGDSKKVDARSDVFSLGVILYELMTGISPFQGDNFSSVMYKILHDQPPLPIEVNPKISESLQNICLKAIEKKPEHRYRTAGEMAEALEKTRSRAIIRTRNRRREQKQNDHKLWIIIAIIAVIVVSAIFLIPSSSKKQSQSVKSKGKIVYFLNGEKIQWQEQNITAETADSISFQTIAGHYFYLFRKGEGGSWKWDENHSLVKKAGTKKIIVPFDRLGGEEQWLIFSHHKKLADPQKFIDKRKTRGIIKPRAKTTGPKKSITLHRLDSRGQKQFLGQIDIAGSRETAVHIMIKKSGGNFTRLIEGVHTVSAGDKMRLEVKTKKAVYLAIFLKDAGKSVSRLYPEKEQESIKLKAGIQFQIPENGSFEFDTTTGTERLCYFFSDDKPDYDRLETWVRNARFTRGVFKAPKLKPNIIKFEHK